MPSVGRKTVAAAAATVGLCTAASALAQLAAFPGAIGFGADATGGRGGNVAVVTNLNSSGAGSFAAAVSQPNTIVVFDVGGYINLDGEVAIASNVTIEGQTAPGQGIGLMDGEISFSGSSNDILRDIRIRQGNGSGSNTGKAGIEMDGGSDIILDHVSVQFGEFDSLDLTNSSNVTVENSLISDAIGQQFGIHGQNDSEMTYAYNIFANDHNRNPDVEDGGSAQFINNVVYNVQAGFTSGNSGGTRMEDVVNNYFITGPSTTSNGDAAFFQVDSGDEMYASGNMEDDNKNGVLDGSPVSPSGATIESSPWFASTSNMPTFTAAGAYAYDAAFAGDSLSRDQLDSLDISQVESLGVSGGTTANGDYLYTAPDQSGLSNGGYGTITGGTAPTSSANDGIPDTWATTHGVGAWAAANGATTTNPAFAMVRDPLGYTEIEDYANSLADQFVSQTWSAGSGNWTTSANWNSAVPGIFQQALIRGSGTADGSVTITTSGNTAESLSIGGNGLAAGEQVNVLSGSLAIEDTIFVGDQNNGTLSISGGEVTASNVQLGNTVYDSSGNPTNFTGTLNLTGGTLATNQLVLGAGTPGNWNTGGSFSWSGGTLQAVGNLTVNAPATIGTGGAFVNANGNTATFSNVLSGSGSFTSTGAGLVILTAANMYAGVTQVDAGILEVEGSLAAQGAASVWVAADPSGKTAFIQSTPAGYSYDGIGSSVSSGYMTGAQLMAGENSANNPNGESVEMRWQLLNSGEAPPGELGGGLISEITTITGMANSGTTGEGQTDAYALEMSFTPSAFTASGAASLSSAAAAGLVHLDYLNTSSQWANAVAGNFLTGTDVFTDVQSSWSVFADAEGITDSNVGNFLGSWGVDTSDDEVWAVIDHNSSFAVSFDAVVPEPSSFALLAAFACLLPRRRVRA